MKKLIILPLLILTLFTLTACSERPYQGPAGTTLVQSDTLEYTYVNEVESNKLFTYTFTEELIFFEGPFAQNYNFQQVDHYELVSENFIAFLNSFDYVYYDKVETDKDYDNLELSIGASENSHNLVDVPVDDKAYHVDAYILDPSGLRIIFSYTEFYSNGVQIVVPYHIAFLAYELLVPSTISTVTGDLSPNGDDVFKVEYTSYLLPIPPNMTFDRETFVNEVYTEEAYIKYFTKESDSLLCGDDDLETCYMNTNVAATIFAEDTTIQALKDMYVAIFDGRMIGNDFVVTVNGIDLEIVFVDQNENILIKYDVYTG